MSSPSIRHRTVQRAGLAIVLVGLLASSGVWWFATDDSVEPDGVMQQRESRDVDRLGGTAAVQTVKFDRWLGSLWHGERLAFTLALLSLALGGGLWWIGGLMGEDVSD